MPNQDKFVNKFDIYDKGIDEKENTGEFALKKLIDDSRSFQDDKSITLLSDFSLSEDFL
jgi:hypothetical protein